MWLCGWRGALHWELGNWDPVPGLSSDSQVRQSVRWKIQHWPPKKTLKSTEKKKRAMNLNQGLLLKIKKELHNTFSNHFRYYIMINFIKHDCC